MTALVEGNRVTLLVSGAEYFPALAAELDAARLERLLERLLLLEHLGVGFGEAVVELGLEFGLRPLGRPFELTERNERLSEQTPELRQPGPRSRRQVALDEVDRLLAQRARLLELVDRHVAELVGCAE